ncbi:hypothetical protein B5K06_32610 [Rhizobium grahamii]|uniref:Uncharacterized protein n=1 Tax=Rhizobium grahamii TaxID=1120045 RepID=A0A370KE37_9HYPH|nr:DUF1839 family protein [Rhizobium grahamii]RDJ01928.1 hypothetical protein B5K06_32610 [Rhizobium grahamii]
MASVFRDLDPATHKPHALHASQGMWPETNCYIDLWIEVLQMALEPAVDAWDSMMGLLEQKL